MLPEDDVRSAAIVYGGEEQQRRQRIRFTPWRKLPELIDEGLEPLSG